jgi:DNA repair exonuclease SbcCD ATPase subunit
MKIPFFDDLSGDALLFVRTFNEVADSIKARQPELNAKISRLESEFDAAYQTLSSTTKRQEAHAAIDRLFDLRVELGQFSNNPVNKIIEPKT